MSANFSTGLGSQKIFVQFEQWDTIRPSLLARMYQSGSEFPESTLSSLKGLMSFVDCQR